MNFKNIVWFIKTTTITIIKIKIIIIIFNNTNNNLVSCISDLKV